MTGGAPSRRLSLSWAFRMALRDLRASAGRLVIALLTIAIGIGGMTASYSLHRALFQDLAERSKSLLAADLLLSAKQELPQPLASLWQRHGFAESREIRFRTMVYAPRSIQSALAQLRVVDDRFPLYGKLETDPATAWNALHSPDTPGALLDESLLFRLGLAIGDEIQLAERKIRVLGVLKTSLGEIRPAAAFVPRIFLPLRLLPAEVLQRKGSLADYLIYLRTPDDAAVRAFLREARPLLQAAHIEAETIADRMRLVGAVSDNAVTFLLLGSLAAYLLGALSAASSVGAYLKRKLPAVVTLRCLGAPSGAIGVFVLLEMLLLGTGAAILGLMLGIGLYGAVLRYLPSLFAVSIPFEIPTDAILLALAAGILTMIFIALAPIRLLRRAPPLAVFRPEYSPRLHLFPIALSIILEAALTITVIFYLFREWRRTLIVAGSILLVVAATAVIGLLVQRTARCLQSERIPFVLRYGVRNLARPGRQSLPLFTALSFAVFLLGTILTVSDILSGQTSSARGSHKPSLFFFDVQLDQEEGVRSLIEQQGLSVMQNVPIVMMRIRSLKGRAAGEILNDPSSTVPPWLLRREYWSTYRRDLVHNERLVEGRWIGTVAPATDPVPISFDRRIGKDLGLNIGDEIEFDVQGVAVRTTIASFREILWEQLERNSLVVFPEGVLEDAPQFRYMTTRTESAEETARIQNLAAQHFPNISVIDLSAILRVVTTVLDHIRQALLAVVAAIGFSAFVALLSTIVSSRLERIREGVLLRTLGASHVQIRRIVLIEYSAVALSAIAAGLLLSAIASWALARFLFKAPYSLPLLSLSVSAIAVLIAVASTALFVGRDVIRRPCAEVLREEGGG